MRLSSNQNGLFFVSGGAYRVLRTLSGDVQFTSYEFWSFLDFSVCVSSGRIKWKVSYSKLSLKMVPYFRVTFIEIETLAMGIIELL